MAPWRIFSERSLSQGDTLGRISVEKPSMGGMDHRRISLRSSGEAG